MLSVSELVCEVGRYLLVTVDLTSTHFSGSKVVMGGPSLFKDLALLDQFLKKSPA